MTTPTEADKRAAKRILGVYADYDLESVAQTERIIAEEVAAEREAADKLKWLLIAHLRADELSFDTFTKRFGFGQSALVEETNKALTAIEKVTG